MTRPASRPLDSIWRRLHAHRQVAGEATVVVATLLFVVIGVILSLSVLHLT